MTIRMQALWILPLLVLTSALAACAKGEEYAARRRGNEIVMCPGSSIRVVSHGQALTIEAPGLITRRYKITDIDVEVNLIPRRERWIGSFGLYRPTGVGDLHLVLEESLQFFSSIEELRVWLDWVGDRDRLIEYTSDGLVVFWGIQRNLNFNPGPTQALNVEAYQLLVRGTKPRNLLGADDAAFTITNPSKSCMIGDKGTSQFDASEPAIIGGRKYSGRALDFMRDREITPAMVEQLIRKGERSEFGRKIMYYYRPRDMADWSNSFTLMTDKSGAILYLVP